LYGAACQIIQGARFQGLIPRELRHHHGGHHQASNQAEHVEKRLIQLHDSILSTWV
jgi:hypothetical protein